MLTPHQRDRLVAMALAKLLDDAAASLARLLLEVVQPGVRLVVTDDQGADGPGKVRLAPITALTASGIRASAIS
jgi:hypothetical protein